MLQSAKKTGRVVIAHEAPLTNGFGAEIAATVQVRGIIAANQISRITGKGVYRYTGKFHAQQIRVEFRDRVILNARELPKANSEVFDVPQTRRDVINVTRHVTYTHTRASFEAVLG